MTGELHYHYSEMNDGTQVVQQADYEFGDSLRERLMEPVAKRYNKRRFKNSRQTPKEFIEAEAEAQVETRAGIILRGVGS